MKTVYLIRHAQSHPSARILEKDWPLSSRGKLQANELAPILESLKIQEVYSSPYLRCRETIEPFHKATGVPITLISDLRERLVALELRDDFPEIWKKSWEDFDFALDGCESCRECQQRIVRAISGILSNANGSEIAILGHGNTIGLFLNFLASDFDRARAEQIRQPDIFKIEFNDNSFHWNREFSLDELDMITTDVRETPIDW